MIRKTLIKILSFISRFKRQFITIHMRPMFASDMHYVGAIQHEDALCAIIIQGPIWHENNFTLETVKLYRQNYPSSTIILSTWDSEDTTGLKELEDDHFKIIKSAKPYCGPGNINLQILSTKVAIDEAKRMSLKYILKTRSDERMYGIDSLRFMINVLKPFPVIGCEGQHERIITTNMGTTKFRPYHHSDLFMFGEVSDMQLYWSAELLTDKSLDYNKFLCEGYLFAEFLRSTGWEYKDTMEDSMRAIGERCIVVDNESVDVYWPKYTSYREYRIRNYNCPAFEMTFKTWLNEAYMPAVDKKP